MVPEHAEGVSASLRADGAQAIPVVADFRDEEQCHAAVDTVVAELGGIDVLANVAGGMFGEGADRSGTGWGGTTSRIAPLPTGTSMPT